jgi:isopentenyl-diphosphate delta-isomerase
MTRAKARANRPAKSRTVSDEPLILVDEDNRATGSCGKTDVHRAGLLHRAFSIFLVDERGRLVLQQRSAKKYHSGGLWANSCCGHPRPGERTATAARRRLREELGVSERLSFGFFARYQAPLDHGMHENELVYVYFGRLTAEPRPDPAEVADVAFLSCEEVKRRLGKNPTSFAFWFQHYFRNHAVEIARLARKAARA